MSKNTNSQHRRLFRHAILLQLEAAAPASLPVETLHQGLHLAGHATEETALIKELGYLEEKHLAASSRPELSQDLPRFRLTADGRDYLERQGLA